jgi:hypothetical protein
MEKQPNSRMCFVCGIDTPMGRHRPAPVVLHRRRGVVRGPLPCACPVPDTHRTGRPKPEHQGYPGQLHGGIISTLLDVPTQISIHSDPLSV